MHVVLEVVEEVDVDEELFSTAGKQFQWIGHHRSHGLGENRPVVKNMKSACQIQLEKGGKL